MKPHRALLLAVALAAVGAPALAQDRSPASPGPRFGPATMGDMRGMMRTLLDDPVISKRINELMSSNPEFKAHFDRMRATMNSAGMMPYGGRGMRRPMMFASPSPSPKP
jgi:hypothetical protein